MSQLVVNNATQIVYGNTVHWQTTVYASDGVTPLSLVGSTVTFRAKLNTFATVNLFSKLSGSTDVVITNAAGGVIDFYIRPTDASLWAIGNQVWFYIDVDTGSDVYTVNRFSAQVLG